MKHGPAFAGDGGAMLRGLADAYDARLATDGPVVRPPVQRAEAASV